MKRAVPDRERDDAKVLDVMDSVENGVVDRCPARLITGAKASTLMAAQSRAETVSDLNMAMVVVKFIIDS